MFNKKKINNLVGIRHWEGIYKFELPYLIGKNVPDEDGIVKVYTCDVEMHIGGQNNLEQGFIATIIISAQKGGVGTTNFIEDISTLIQKGYIDELVIPSNGPIYDRIRWIERNHFPSENYQVVSLEWNQEGEFYFGPKWGKLEDDWILEENKLESYI